MNKATREAIENGCPMRWKGDSVGGFGVKLVAVTYTYETGKARERILWRTFSIGAARKTHHALIRAGAKLTGPDPETAYRDFADEREIAWNAPENARIRAAFAAGQEMRRV